MCQARNPRATSGGQVRRLRPGRRRDGLLLGASSDGQPVLQLRDERPGLSAGLSWGLAGGQQGAQRRQKPAPRPPPTLPPKTSENT